MGLLDYLNESDPAAGGNPGLISGTGFGGDSSLGDIISAMGLSMLASTDRRMPFNGQVLSSALDASSKRQDRDAQAQALEAALISAGLPPDQAKAAARSPQAAALLLQAQQQRRQQENASSISGLWGGSPAGGSPGGGAPPPMASGASLSASPSLAARAGDPAIESSFIEGVREGGLTNPIALATVAAYGQAESKYSPKNVYGTWSDPSERGQPGTSGGVLSWRNERLAALRDFAAQNGDDPAKPSVDTQAKFFLAEDPALIESLNAARSPEEAHSLMANAWKFAGYNRPGQGEHANRLNLTRQYLDRFGGGQQRADADVTLPDGVATSYASGSGGAGGAEASETGLQIPAGDPRLATPAFDRVHGRRDVGRPPVDVAETEQDAQRLEREMNPEAFRATPPPMLNFGSLPGSAPVLDASGFNAPLDTRTTGFPNVGPMPPSRPADLPAPGAMQADGRGPGGVAPRGTMPEFDTSGSDGGAGAFARMGMGRRADANGINLSDPSRYAEGTVTRRVLEQRAQALAQAQGGAGAAPGPREAYASGRGAPQGSMAAPAAPGAPGVAAPMPRLNAQEILSDPKAARESLPHLVRMLNMDLPEGTKKAVHDLYAAAINVAKPTERTRQLIEAGYTPGTPEYQAAYKNIINADRIPRGFEMDPDTPGQLRPIKGGPQDPALAGKKDAPSGYRWTGDGNLESIKGGPADPATKQNNKPLPHNAVKDIAAAGESYGDYTRIVSGFRDNFAGYGLEILGDLKNAAGRSMPGASAETKAQAEWWQDYQDKKNVIRNKLFGSALTTTEKAEFDKANINPGMSPDVVRKNLERQHAAATRAAQKMAGYYIKSGRNPDEIEAALGIPLEELGLGAGGASVGAPAGNSGRGAPPPDAGTGTTTQGFKWKVVR
jgi:hypothetical protein